MTKVPRGEVQRLLLLTVLVVLRTSPPRPAAVRVRVPNLGLRHFYSLGSLTMKHLRTGEGSGTDAVADDNDAVAAEARRLLSRDGLPELHGLRRRLVLTGVAFSVPVRGEHARAPSRAHRAYTYAQCGRTASAKTVGRQMADGSVDSGCSWHRSYVCAHMPY